MNKKVWLSTLLASLGAGALLAQDTNAVIPANPPTNPVVPAAVTLPPVTNAPALATTPAAPAPAVAPTDSAAPAPEVTPAKPKAKKKIAHKPAVKAVSSGLAASHLPVDPPVSATVKVDALNMRGLASLSGEVLGKLHKGDTVTITEEVTLDKVRPGEPARWARINLPTNTPVWVSAHLVDSKTMTVNTKKLNVRGGPGENFNVIGHLDKGTAIKEIHKKEGWIQIEPPANASAFVSLDLLDKQAGSTPVPAPVIETTPIADNAAPAPTAPLPEPTVVNVAPDTNSTVLPANDVPTAVAPVPALAPAPVAQTPVVAAPVGTGPLYYQWQKAPVVAAPEPVALVTPDQSTNDLPKRVVTREGVVRISHNIQAPTYYELRNSASGELIDYLNPTKNETDLRSYVGKKVLVSGEESMDRRWKFTPVVEVESIDLP